MVEWRGERQNANGWWMKPDGGAALRPYLLAIGHEAPYNRPTAMDEAKPPYRLDRTAFSVVSLDEQDDDGDDWQTRSPAERLQALEYLRRMTYGHAAATARLQRVLEVAQLGED